MNAPIITFFNNKGGVGKTSTLYNLSRMFAKRGKQVLAVDLDPQANLTSLCLEDESLYKLWDNEVSDISHQTIYHAVQPLIDAVGDIKIIQPQKVTNSFNYNILPGDLRLSQFEDRLATEWNSVLGGKPIGLNITSSFARLIKNLAKQTLADVVFVDVGPNLGAINRAALIASDYIVIPLVPDLFSLQGLINVGKYLIEWRKDWQNGLQRANEGNIKINEYPEGKMQPLGYILLQHRERQSRLVGAHQRWADRIPHVYTAQVLKSNDQDQVPDPNMIGQVRNYQSMMALSHDARKPVFELRPADGAIGSHLRVVQEAYETYSKMADSIALRIGMKFD
jgi:chromosome partitioning protein